MRELVVNPFAAHLARIASNVREDLRWPSPEFGFVLYWSALETSSLFDDVPTSFTSTEALRRLSEAPVLASYGFLLGLEDLPFGQTVVDQWDEGMRRIVDRDAFPADRASFVFRPLELLGLALGCTHKTINAESITWLKGVLQRAEEKYEDSGVWDFLLGSFGAFALQVPWKPRGVRLMDLSLTELSLLSLLQKHSPSFVASLLGNTSDDQLAHQVVARYLDDSSTIPETGRLAICCLAVRRALHQCVVPLPSQQFLGEPSMRDPKKVFVVHGRNAMAVKAMKLFLQAMKLEQLEFDEVKNEIGGSVSIFEIVRTGMERAQGIVVIFTPDELAKLRDDLVLSHDKTVERERWQPRPNVILEAGMALALDPRRTILLILGDADICSDLSGIHVIHVTNGSRKRLYDALIGVGCTAPKFMPDWSDPAMCGDFDAAR